jgi:predicted MPP superfamily phosphohydrolase
MKDVINIQYIVEPLWSKPTIVMQGYKLSIVINTLIRNIGCFKVALKVGELSYPLEVQNIFRLRDGLYRIVCKVPFNYPCGFYSLIVRWKDHYDFMPNSIRILNRFPKNFKFVHISDPHVCSILEDKPGAVLADAVRQINKIMPEFVLLTGDIVNRYDKNKQVLDSRYLEEDYKLVQKILLNLKVPLFITAGNHDLAFKYMRELYRLYISKPTKGEFVNYAFSYGEYRFITFEAFSYYDYRNLKRIKNSLAPEQVEWLKSELIFSQKFVSRIMFYHYDYNKELPEIFDNYRINLSLSGHSGPTEEKVLGKTPTTLMVDRGIKEDRHIGIIDIIKQKDIDEPIFKRHFQGISDDTID